MNITALENGIPKKAVWSSINSLVEKIVDDSLMLEYGKDKRIILNEVELESAIQDIVRDYPENIFKETLLTKCIDYNEWKERLREQLLIKKIVKKQTDALAPISHKSIKAYYNKRKEDFRHPPRAKLIHIVTKTRRDAEAVLTRLNEGEDIAELMKKQSVYSGFRGDYAIDWKTRDMFPEPLSDIIFSIPIGELSKITKTSYGFHIIKVLKRESAGIKGLLEVMGAIENRLLEEAIESHYTAWIKELRNSYTVKINYTLLDKIRNINEGN